MDSKSLTKGLSYISFVFDWTTTLQPSCRASQVPRFPNLPTLKSLSKIDFTDGDQHWHVLQVRHLNYYCITLLTRDQRILPLVHNIVPSKYRPLLRAIRLLSQIYVLATFSHQTSSHVSAGHDLINQFSDLLPVSISHLLIRPEDDHILPGSWCAVWKEFQFPQNSLPSTLV